MCAPPTLSIPSCWNFFAKEQALQGLSRFHAVGRSSVLPYVCVSTITEKEAMNLRMGVYTGGFKEMKMKEEMM